MSGRTVTSHLDEMVLHKYGIAIRNHMRSGTRKLITKEIQQDADEYTGGIGEVWFQEGTQTLRFGNDETPGGISIGGSGGTNGATTVCAPGVATIIYTASSSQVRTLKVTLQAVGYETSVVDFPDTHSAEIMALVNLRSGLGEASVYGVTYTSVNPLVTFDAQVTGGVLEITAQPTSLINSITVNSIGIEIES